MLLYRVPRPGPSSTRSLMPMTSVTPLLRAMSASWCVASLGTATSLMVSASTDGATIAFVRESLSAPPEIWAGTPAHLVQLTHVNAGEKPDWGKAVNVRWKSDAFNVQGFRVAVNPETGEVRILQSVQAADAGVVMNPEQCRGQVEGGVAQAIGSALYEQVLIGPDGTVLTQALRNYHIPQLADVPVTEVLLP